jgi:hypothetical protein
VYRWATGAVELCWATLFSNQFSEFCIISFFVAAYTIASFASWWFAYPLWVGLLLLMGASAYGDDVRGHMPLRQLNVSCVVVMNSFYWISNLTSVVWVLLVPFIIAFMSEAPLSASASQAMTWAFVSLVLRLPTGLMTDRYFVLCYVVLRSVYAYVTIPPTHSH